MVTVLMVIMIIVIMLVIVTFYNKHLTWSSQMVWIWCEYNSEKKVKNGIYSKAKVSQMPLSLIAIYAIDKNGLGFYRYLWLFVAIKDGTYP